MQIQFWRTHNSILMEIFYLALTLLFLRLPRGDAAYK